MRLASKEWKRQAREALTGHYSLAMAAFVMAEFIITAISLPFQRFLFQNPSGLQVLLSLLAAAAISLFSSVLNGGLTYIHLSLARKKEARVTDLFHFFSRRPDRFILAKLAYSAIFLLAAAPAVICSAFAYLERGGYLLLTALWIVTCVLLAYLSISFQFLFFLLADRPKDGVMENLRESLRLTRGKKARLLYLNVSFLGMAVLSILSLGIGLLWVAPYISQTQAAFYEDAVKNTEIHL